ncbi:hypothetical protein BJ742DRAFT_781838 [Cladochytrium replicatum]|nr:hypothetical protein BJ742DRAFT_781838 [Cladochytrium replicatum]
MDSGDFPGFPPRPAEQYPGQQFQFVNGQWYTKRVKVHLREILYVSAFAFLIIWHLIPLIGFILYRHTKVVQYRSVMLSLWHHLAIVFILIMNTLLPGIQLYPCGISPIFAVVGWNLFFAVLTLRSARLIRMHQFQVWGIALGNALRVNVALESPTTPSPVRGHIVLSPNSSARDLSPSSLHRRTNALMGAGGGEGQDLESASHVETVGVKPEPPWCVRHRRWLTDSVIHSFLVGWTCLWIVYVVLIDTYEPLLGFGVFPDEDGYCLQSFWYYAPIYFFVIFFVLFSPALLWSMRNIQDTYKIKRELLSSIGCTFPIYVLHFVWDQMEVLKDLAPGLTITVPPALIIMSIFSGWLPLFDAINENWTSQRAKEENRDGWDSGTIIHHSRSPTQNEPVSRPSDPAKEKAETAISTAKPTSEERPAKQWRFLSKAKNLTAAEPDLSGRDGFYRTLTDPELYRQFREFAAQDFTVECCSFYEYYVHLAQNVTSCVPPEPPPIEEVGVGEESPTSGPPHVASKRFMLPSADAPDPLRPAYFLMKKLFFVPGSELELNIPSAMRANILNVVKEPNPIPMNVFDAAKNEVMYMLFTNTFDKWKMIKCK